MKNKALMIITFTIPNTLPPFGKGEGKVKKEMINHITISHKGRSTVWYKAISSASNVLL
jgi:hypothetical protein